MVDQGDGAGARSWRDGELIDVAEATVHVLSHAAIRGSEVFDVLGVTGTAAGPAAIGLRSHVARFDRSMELMGMERPYDVRTLERAVASTVLANPGSELVKVVAVWSDIADGSLPASRIPSVHVFALPGHGLTVVADPVRAVTADMPKIPASVLPPSLKVAASYTPAVRQQLAALDAGYDDVIFRSIDGTLAEATTQSLLVVLDGRILAPSLDVVLDGITRRLLLDLAHHAGITVEVRDVHWDEVERADELILTSTTRFVRPIVELDGRSLPGAPGPVADRLGTALDLLLGGGHELSDRWLTPLVPLVADDRQQAVASEV